MLGNPSDWIARLAPGDIVCLFHCWGQRLENIPCLIELLIFQINSKVIVQKNLKCKIRRRKSCRDPKLDLLPSDVLHTNSHADHVLSVLVKPTTINHFDITRGRWHIQSCDSAYLVSKMYVLTFTCLCDLQHQAWSAPESLLPFLLHSHVEFTPEQKTSFTFFIQTKPRACRDTLCLCHIFCFAVAACPPCSQSTCFACDLSADSPGIFSLKSSASVCSATCSIVNTSKTVQTVG